MSEHAPLQDEDYQQILAFIGRTPRGQAFLSEHARRNSSMAVNEVYSVVTRLHDAWNEHYRVANASKHLEVLRRELQDMSASISQARREIASLRPREEGSERILSATSELDQIVLSTERASIEILNAAERIMELTGRLRATSTATQICDDLDTEATNIFTACSFQDLTGQRTTKVVNALRYIEQRILAIFKIWGAEDNPGSKEVIPDREDSRPDAHLLHGPSADGIDQTLVDRLLNGELSSEEAAAVTASLGAAQAAASQAAASAQAAKKTEEPEDGPSPLDQSAIDDLFG